MVFMEFHNEDSERDRQQIHWGKQKTPGHRCFLCLAHPQSGWTWHFLQLTHTVRTLQRQLVWDWSAEWWQEQCLRVISVSKIHNKPWGAELIAVDCFLDQERLLYSFFSSPTKITTNIPKHEKNAEREVRKRKDILYQVLALALFYAMGAC